MTTALVTGATSGIGRAFVDALAARGDDVVLVARDGDRLGAIAAEIRDVHHVTATPLIADLFDEAGLAAVEARLRAVSDPVELLVNNAGMGTFGDFIDLDIADDERAIRLNVLALVRLTHAALATMVKRGRGAIVNVSSLAAYQPDPSSATYGATKAFVNSFTHAIHEEVRHTGVHVMVVCPGYTHTEFHERAGLGPTALPEFVWQSPDEVVAAALRDLDRGRALSIPGALNKVLCAMTSVAPAGITRRFARIIVRRTGSAA
jgi:short-subunit dehydrogenase